MIKDVLLLENYNYDSRMLHESFLSAGFDGKTLVINDEGFLPENAISIYDYYSRETRKRFGKPRYFNQINIPDYWHIEANNNMGHIYDFEIERGRIYYFEPKNNRIVKAVEWLDKKGKVRSCDHYNCYGELYARSFFDNKDNCFCKIYFDSNGKELIYENYFTSDITLTLNGKVYVYKNKKEFILGILKDMDAMNSRLYINSLSTPLFVSNNMSDGRGGDVLFWQEEPRNDIPGNMQSVFRGETNIEKIFVQNKDSYEKLISLGCSKEVVKPLGYVYNFEKENSHTNEVLICTNSDTMEKLDELVNEFSNLSFNIVAITEMSTKLLDFGKYNNVRLFPNCRKSVISELFKKCDIYLDINYENEIVNAVNRAFVNNLLIAGFTKTAHNKRYTCPNYLFENYEKFVDFLKRVVDNVKEFNSCIECQKEYALVENIDKYKEILKR